MNRSIDILLKIKKWGTPTYIYDENQLRKGFQELRNALPECVDIFMCSKSQYLGNNAKVSGYEGGHHLHLENLNHEMILDIKSSFANH